MYYAARKHWKSGLFVFLIVLAGTVGLVLYMNFADGTHEDKVLGEGHLEVRDRDYFWTPGFIMFGMMIGVGLSALFDMLRTALAARRLSNRIRDIVLASFCLTLLMPIAAIANNYYVNDRSRNYFAYDYAWNLLQSARPNAVLFTNGDNDTFPVWCLQHVYGVRPDVKIANLSLINTDWYGHQLKNELGVPIGFSDKQISTLRHIRTQDGVLRVQDQMVSDIIDKNLRNAEQIPIQFAITVSSANKNYKGKPLDPYLQMEGMALTSYYPKEQPDAVDVGKTHDMYWDLFKFRGVTDTTIFKDENAARLVNNYISGFLFLADTLQRAGRVEDAAAEIYKGIEMVGSDADAWGYLCRMYALHGRYDDARRVLEEAPQDVPRDRLKLFLAAALKEKGRKDEARQYLEEVYASLPDSREAFNELFRFYYDERMQYQLASLLENYSLRHPEDAQIREAYDQLKHDAPELFVKQDAVPATEPEVGESLEHGRKVSVVGIDSAGRSSSEGDSSTGN
jgi:tetratricopeptide (TPR) repeat protein